MLIGLLWQTKKEYRNECCMVCAFINLNTFLIDDNNAVIV